MALEDLLPAGKQFWMGLGFDAVEQTLILLGFASNRKESQARAWQLAERPEVGPHVYNIESFLLGSQIEQEVRESAQALRRWLRRQNIPHSEIIRIVDELGEMLPTSLQAASGPPGKLYADVVAKMVPCRAEDDDSPEIVYAEEFVEDIDSTGGIEYDRHGYPHPVADPDWIDLGETYLKAVAALGRTAKVANDPDEEEL